MQWDEYLLQNEVSNLFSAPDFFMTLPKHFLAS